MEDVLTQLSTDELLRMLELLDMLESKAPIQASDRVRILHKIDYASAMTSHISYARHYNPRFVYFLPTF